MRVRIEAIASAVAILAGFLCLVYGASREFPSAAIPDLSSSEAKPKPTSLTSPEMPEHYSSITRLFIQDPPKTVWATPTRSDATAIISEVTSNEIALRLIGIVKISDEETRYSIRDDISGIFFYAGKGIGNHEGIKFVSGDDKSVTLSVEGKTVVLTQ